MNSLHNVLFYPRLAVTSMKKNRGIYLPYLMAGGVMAGLLYVLDSVGVMVEASQMAGGGIMQVIVEICGSICTVFAVMILFYINSFVMKRRKKEFGLFCVLGMEKKHLGFVLFWEVFRQPGDGDYGWSIIFSGHVFATAKNGGAAGEADVCDTASVSGEDLSHLCGGVCAGVGL